MRPLSASSIRKRAIPPISDKAAGTTVGTAGSRLAAITTLMHIARTPNENAAKKQKPKRLLFSLLSFPLHFEITSPAINEKTKGNAQNNKTLTTEVQIKLSVSVISISNSAFGFSPKIDHIVKKRMTIFRTQPKVTRSIERHYLELRAAFSKDVEFLDRQDFTRCRLFSNSIAHSYLVFLTSFNFGNDFISQRDS